MTTIDRIQQADRLQRAALALLERLLQRLGDFAETKIVNAAYAVAERASKQVAKAHAKIGDAEDKLIEVEAGYTEAQRALRAEYDRALQALRNERARNVQSAEGKIAEAAMALVAAEKGYDAQAAEILEKLDVDVKEPDVA